MKKVFRGWMKKKGDPTSACKFETVREQLAVGDEITDCFGVIWTIDVIF